MSNSTLQVPFIIALNKGNKWVNDGMVSGPGIILRLSITTTANTKTETAAMKRNINLSLIFIGFKNQDARIEILFSNFYSWRVLIFTSPLLLL